MDEIADRLDTSPSRRHATEHIPCRLAQFVGFAVSAAHEVNQTLVGQIGDRNFLGLESRGIDPAVVFDRCIAPDRQIALGRRQSTALIAE